MTDPQRPLSIGLMPLENRRESILHLAIAADQRGYNGFYLPETWSYDMTVLLAECAVRTEQIQLGPTVLGLWGRSAAQIAMAAATLHAVSGGRAVLGLGSSTPQLTEGLHDVRYDSPYLKIRQTVQQVRALLAGERVPLANVPDARPLKLNLESSEASADIPIWLAASAPKSIQLAGELCDGWVPFLFPRDRLPDGMALMQEGRARAETPAGEPQIYASVPVSVAKDEETARAGAAWFVAFYITTMGPIYRGALERLGFGKEVQMVMEANAGQKAAIVPPAAETLMEQLTIYGTPQQAREKLESWYDAGAAMPGLLLAPNLSHEQIDFMLDAFRPG